MEKLQKYLKTIGNIFLPLSFFQLLSLNPLISIKTISGSCYLQINRKKSKKYKDIEVIDINGYKYTNDYDMKNYDFILE